MKSGTAILMQPTRIPLNMRKSSYPTGTTWPVETSHVLPRQQPSSRNIARGPFRRYNDGTLDVEWAKGLVHAALRKSNSGIPLTEYEACVLSSVYGVEYTNLPKSVVDIKARLTPIEKGMVRNSIDNDYNAIRDSIGGG